MFCDLMKYLAVISFVKTRMLAYLCFIFTRAAVFIGDVCYQPVTPSRRLFDLHEARSHAERLRDE